MIKCKDKVVTGCFARKDSSSLFARVRNEITTLNIPPMSTTTMLDVTVLIHRLPAMLGTHLLDVMQVEFKPAESLF